MPGKKGRNGKKSSNKLEAGRGQIPINRLLLPEQMRKALNYWLFQSVIDFNNEDNWLGVAGVVYGEQAAKINATAKVNVVKSQWKKVDSRLEEFCKVEVSDHTDYVAWPKDPMFVYQQRLIEAKERMPRDPEGKTLQIPPPEKKPWYANVPVGPDGHPYAKLLTTQSANDNSSHQGPQSKTKEAFVGSSHHQPPLNAGNAGLKRRSNPLQDMYAVKRLAIPDESVENAGLSEVVIGTHYTSVPGPSTMKMPTIETRKVLQQVSFYIWSRDGNMLDAEKRVSLENIIEENGGKVVPEKKDITDKTVIIGTMDDEINRKKFKEGERNVYPPGSIHIVVLNLLASERENFPLEDVMREFQEYRSRKWKTDSDHSESSDLSSSWDDDEGEVTVNISDEIDDAQEQEPRIVKELEEEEGMDNVFSDEEDEGDKENHLMVAYVPRSPVQQAIGVPFHGEISKESSLPCPVKCLHIANAAADGPKPKIMNAKDRDTTSGDLFPPVGIRTLNQQGSLTSPGEAGNENSQNQKGSSYDKRDKGALVSLLFKHASPSGMASMAFARKIKSIYDGNPDVKDSTNANSIRCFVKRLIENPEKYYNKYKAEFGMNEAMLELVKLNHSGDPKGKVGEKEKLDDGMAEK